MLGLSAKASAWYESKHDLCAWAWMEYKRETASNNKQPLATLYAYVYITLREQSPITIFYHIMNEFESLNQTVKATQFKICRDKNAELNFGSLMCHC